MTAARVILCVVGAVLAHTALMLFGGIFFMHDDSLSSHRDIELVTDALDKDKPEDQNPDQPQEELKADAEPPPDPNQVLASVDTPVAADDAPALDAASLSAIEQMLNGNGANSGGGDFGTSGSLASGGVIGGKGKAGAEEDEFQGAFSMSQIDQRPRAVYQVAGGYPAELRARNLEGVVSLIFIVDETGRVVNPRVEKSSHPEFEAPALEALRQWKFEAGVKAGQRVSCRMRVSIRFQPR